MLTTTPAIDFEAYTLCIRLSITLRTLKIRLDFNVISGYQQRHFSKHVVTGD